MFFFCLWVPGGTGSFAGVLEVWLDIQNLRGCRVDGVGVVFRGFGGRPRV